MKLLKMVLENFQGIKELTLDFDGKSASIYGDNATGKTTVFNAITWLLFDKASTNAKNYTPKTKGKDGDVHNLEHSSEAVFKTETDRIVTLKKVYKEVYKKKRGSATEEFSGHTIDYYTDGVPVKEKEFVAAIENLCGDSELMKMLTMPDYFPEQLSWEARRKLLLTICGDVSDEDVIHGNSELKELSDYLIMPGTTDQSYSVDEYKKIASAKKSDINKQLDEIPGRIDEAQRAIPDTTGMNADEIEDNIAILTAKKDKLLEEKATVSTGDAATIEIKKALSELETDIQKSKSAHIKKQNEVNEGTNQEIAKARDELRYIIKKQQTNADETTKLQEKRSKLVSLREQLVKDYQEVNNVCWDEGKEMCPTCGQGLPPEEIEELKSQFNIRKSKKLTEINERGQEECSKDIIKDVEKQLAEKEVEGKAIKQTLEEQEKLIEALQSKLQEVEPFEDTGEYAAIASKMDELRVKLNDESKCTIEAVRAVQAKIDTVNADIEAEKAKTLQLKMADSQNKRIKELNQKEQTLAAEYEKLEKGIYLCEQFIKAKVSALTEKINDKFKNVRFRLFQEQINGGLKEDCEVMIPTKEGRMVPFAFANNAARINAGLEIIAAISESCDIQMPVFIDNAESVTHLDDMDTQIIRLVVSESDKQLRLEVEA